MGETKIVISFSQLIDQYGKEINAVIIAVRGTHSRLENIQQLKDKGTERIGIFVFSAHD